ncbi:MAG: hypothetical protein LJE84_01260 [Gammaproteobacteria bacterium]|nr:hypothetical protein [Gammaproteobacteria bacterium]
MNRRTATGLLGLGLLLPGVLQAGAEWTFSEPLNVDGNWQAGVFHHLESSGRRNLVVHGSEVCLTWEDNRDGTPQVRVACRAAGDPEFSPRLRPGAPRESYEPALLALGDQLLVAFEAEDGVRAGLVGQPEALALSPSGAQVTLAPAPGGQVLAVWAEKRERHRQLRGAMLRLEAGALRAGPAMWLKGIAGDGDQGYPAAAWLANREAHVVAWEDRRFRNTVLMSAIGSLNDGFSLPMQVNGLWPPHSSEYGVSSGVARIALRGGAAGVLAAWADKRNFRMGHDIYAALAADSGRFGDNQLVQDGFAEGVEQWHPALAMGTDALVVAWDDDRDGNSDLWLTTGSGGRWSDDWNAAAMAGPLLQTHPALALDSSGRLHVAWVERREAGGATRLRYAIGTPVAAAAVGGK